MNVSKSCLLSRIKKIDNENYRIYVELHNKQIITIDNIDTSEFSINSVLLINVDDNSITHAPDELWPSTNWIGVIRLIHDDITIIDSGGQWNMVKTKKKKNYSVGNTVEINEKNKIVRVLSKTPIRLNDLPEIDESVINGFKSTKEELIETFEDFGGFPNVVNRARELIEIPLQKNDQLKKIGARPIKGVLFTGAPGSGKTMLARIIANIADATFFEISGPQVFSKWYGQSEEIIRKLFAAAKNEEQAIIFFDEIDSIGGHRDENSHEASRRVVAQLLTEMDGFTTDNNVIVIAATNRPQDIDPALLRPGRFDWEITFPEPTLDDRIKILLASSRGKSIKGIIDYSNVAINTEHWSAAELSAIWTEAALLAAYDNRNILYEEDFIGGFERVRDHRKLSVMRTRRRTNENSR